ncbi:MAG: CoA-binding protein [Thermoanaerobaculia bacterium]|nr:CoA-binding protein [Thermoanaerobaculia bacterium]
MNDSTTTKATEAKTIAVLGASQDRAKYGNKCVRAYVQKGWTVVPVNPNVDSVEGIPSVARLGDLAGQSIDRVSVYLPPAVTDAELEAMAALGAKEVWFNPGATNSTVSARARSLGIPIVEACSIVNIGLSPSQFG